MSLQPSSIFPCCFYRGQQRPDGGYYPDGVPEKSVCPPFGQRDCTGNAAADPGCLQAGRADADTGDADRSQPNPAGRAASPADGSKSGFFDTGFAIKKVLAALTDKAAPPFFVSAKRQTRHVRIKPGTERGPVCRKEKSVCSILEYLKNACGIFLLARSGIFSGGRNLRRKSFCQIVLSKGPVFWRE